MSRLKTAILFSFGFGFVLVVFLIAKKAFRSILD
jgi:hypothetical protein